MNWKDALYHDGSPFFRHPAKPALGEDVTLTLRVPRKAPVTAVYLRSAPEGEQEMARMERGPEDGEFVLWRGQVNLARTPFHYRFLVLAEDDGWWFNEAGAARVMPLDADDFRLHAGSTLPDWVPETVFYQIFPDRFANGDPSISPRTGEYEYRGKKPRLREWDDIAPDPHKNGHLDFYGGDLAGIEERIPWLAELGVNGVYLTPVFESPSNHKYDTQDYDRIDPHFGSNGDFARLVGKLHASGIRILLDGVFNHVGVAHKWFNRGGHYEGGAARDAESPYREFFRFKHWPDDYACWKGIESLPKLDYASRALRDAMYGGPEAVAVKWLLPPYGTDGWRLDVANMLGRLGDEQRHAEVWREFRAACKAARPDAYLMGEHFFDGTELLQGDMLDGTQNYQGFSMPVWRWLCGKDSFLSGWERVDYPTRTTAAELAAQLRLFRARIGYDVALRQFNCLNSHDTPRFWSMVGKDADLFRIGLALLFTYPGAPCLYYGDEIGMEGLEDPDCRRPMIWEEGRQDRARLALVRALVALRRGEPALAWGGLKELLVTDETFAYARVHGQRVVACVVRRGAAPEDVAVPFCRAGVVEGVAREFFTGIRYPIERGCLHLPMGAADSALLLVEEA